MSDSGVLVKPIIPVLVGPTAVGKTAVALEVVDRFNLEIVSCDSRQIYRRLNIGTAKPTRTELAGRPYHLIDYVEPDAVYSAARYREDADSAFTEVLSRGRVPLVVGGSGLYLRALVVGLFETPPADPAFRASLEAFSAAELHCRLAGIDSAAARVIPAGNRPRLVRALEIHNLTGLTKSELAKSGTYPPSRYEFRYFLLSRSREKLYQIINLRVDNMIRDGLIAEVDQLCAAGLADSPVLRRTVGYREVLDFRDGQFGHDRCIELIKQRTRNYAKRQLTWFRHQVRAETIELESSGWRQKMFGWFDKFKLDRKLC